MKAPKRACCRSIPRCARCPALLGTEPRAAGGDDGGDSELIAAFLTGHGPPGLPACIRDALGALEAARAQAAERSQ